MKYVVKKKQQKREIIGQCLDLILVFSCTWMQSRLASGIWKCKEQLGSIIAITKLFQREGSRLFRYQKNNQINGGTTGRKSQGTWNTWNFDALHFGSGDEAINQILISSQSILEPFFLWNSGNPSGFIPWECGAARSGRGCTGWGSRNCNFVLGLFPVLSKSVDFQPVPGVCGSPVPSSGSEPGPPKFFWL